MLQPANQFEATIAPREIKRPAARPSSLGLSLLLTILIALLMIIGRVPEALLSRYAYAVEAGQIKANSEHLTQADELSNVFRMVARVARPGVVQIRVKSNLNRELLSKLEAEEKELRKKVSGLQEELKNSDDPRASPKFQELIDTHDELQRMQARIRRELSRGGEGSGSGIIIDTDGYILTNNHVVEAGGDMQVMLADRRTFEAKLVGTDSKTDVALVKIEAPDLQPLKLGDSDKVEIGDWVLAVGAPFGLTGTVTHGIISAKGITDINTGRDITYQNFLQTDAAINPGNSGGPLLNLRGEVIGINTAIATTEGVNSGVAFTIPSNQAGRIVKQLRSSGEVARGWLGIRMADLSAEDARKLNLPDPNGVLVDVIYEGSPADKAGLMVEDVILNINGASVSTLANMRSMIADVLPGEKATAIVWRDGDQRTVEITMDRQPANIERYTAQSKAIVARTIGRLGLEARTMRPTLAQALFARQQPREVINQAIAQMQNTGVYVVNKVSDRFDIRPGEMIVGLNDHEVKSISDLQIALSKIGDQKETKFSVVSTEGDRRTVVEKVGP